MQEADGDVIMWWIREEAATNPFALWCTSRAPMAWHVYGNALTPAVAFLSASGVYDPRMSRQTRAMLQSIRGVAHAWIDTRA